MGCTKVRMKKYHPRTFSEIRNGKTKHLHTSSDVSLCECISGIVVVDVAFLFSLECFRYFQVPQFLPYSNLRQMEISSKALEISSSRSERLEKVARAC